ncbi:MAG TPA: aldolase catalytic domain-containing protein [Phycisphaerae bacterium]|nr:aldolase catalytic domain-containing protein [Phycisphaerae bacterium]
MYRPEIKVVDCTIRDGGLMNDSQFSLETVREVYKAICASGVDYVELGYRNSKEHFSPDQYGPWRFCDEDHLCRAVDGIDGGNTQIAIMQDAHKAVPEDVLPAEESVVKLIRVATYVKDVDKAIHLANNATDKGYDCTINIMAISREGPPFLDEALQQIEEETKALAVYVVDSYGALYSEEVHFFVEKYQMHLKTKEVGGHFHNAQQLAFANTIESIIKGANFLDGTLLGLGRGAGNCPLELLLGFLKNPKFRIRPLLEGIQKAILPLQETMTWGYHIPYMVSGLLNQHPREAMAWMAGENAGDFVGFYDRVTEEFDE